MIQVTEITDEYLQTFTLELENNDTMTLDMEYDETQECWFANITYNTKTINGIKIVNSVNLLNQYKNIFPFGIQIDSLSNQDPFLLDDFLDNTSMYILSQEDLDSIEVSL